MGGRRAANGRSGWGIESKRMGGLRVASGRSAWRMGDLSGELKVRGSEVGGR